MASKTPKAVLSIELLTDQDFCQMMGSARGREAFGVFCAVVVAGRERLQRGRAERMGDTDSLIFLDKLDHVLSLMRVSAAALRGALDLMSELASQNGGEPWAYIGFDGSLIVRSFFKYHERTWGGPRPGAGRPRGDGGGNHLEKLDSRQPGIKSAEASESSGAPALASASASASALASALASSPLPPQRGRDGRKLNIPSAWDGYTMALHDLCDLHPFEWVQRAIDENAGKQISRGMVPRYLTKVLLSWKEHGGPPDVPPPRVAHGTTAGGWAAEDDAAARERERLDCIRAEEEAERRRAAKVGA